MTVPERPVPVTWSFGEGGGVVEESRDQAGAESAFPAGARGNFTAFDLLFLLTWLSCMVAGLKLGVQAGSLRWAAFGLMAGFVVGWAAGLAVIFILAVTFKLLIGGTIGRPKAAAPGTSPGSDGGDR